MTKASLAFRPASVAISAIVGKHPSMNTPCLLLIRRLSAISVAVFLVTQLSAPLAAADEAQVRDELRQLLAVYEKAINSGDVSPLETLFAPETTGVVVDSQPFKNFAELKVIYDDFHATFPGSIYRIKMNSEPSLLFGDIAIAHGTCEESVKMGSSEFPYTSQWTAALKRDNGQWKLLRSQFTMDPFRSSIVQYFVFRAKLIFGLSGLALGALLGFLAAWLFGKRRLAPSNP